MKTFFVASDIHGFFTEWQDALKEKGFDANNPEHIIIVCGDLLDRGGEAKRTVDFAYEMFNSNRFIFVRGNHEDLFKEMVVRGDVLEHDVSNGTADTIYQLAKNKSTIWYDFSYDPKWDFLLNNTINYYETEHYIFVHGWIPTKRQEIPWYQIKDNHFEYNPDWRNSTNDEWYASRWVNGMDMWHYKIKEPDKTIVCGHWHCSWGWSHLDQKRPEFPQKNKKNWAASFEPYAKDGILAIDACTAYTKIVNVIRLEEDQL